MKVKKLVGKTHRKVRLGARMDLTTGPGAETARIPNRGTVSFEMNDPEDASLIYQSMNL